MKIKIEKICKKHMKEVISLLNENLSEYKPNFDEYNKIWDVFSSQENVHAVVAITDQKVVGYGALFFEVKIRGGIVGHVEDIVTHKDFKKKGIGKLIQDNFYLKSLERGCHKIALQCKDYNVSFYKKCKYNISGVGMQKFL